MTEPYKQIGLLIFFKKLKVTKLQLLLTDSPERLQVIQLQFCIFTLVDKK